MQTKDKEMKQKDFIGGLLGGVMGIIVAGYFYDWLAPLGCIVGWFPGFYFREIVQLWKRTKYLSGKYWQVQVHICQHNFKRFDKKFEEIAYFYHLVHVLVKPVLFTPIWLITFAAKLCTPSKNFFLVWLRAHMNHRATALSWLALLSYWAMNVLVLGSIFYYCSNIIDPFNPQEPSSLGIIWIISAVVSIAIAFFAAPLHLLIESDNRYRAMKNYLKKLERYLVDGKLAYFGFDLKKLFKVELALFVFLAMAIAHFAIRLCLLTPIFFVVFFLKGTFKLISEPRGWLCLGITLTMTILTVIYTRQWFDNRTLLWVIALANGTVCGVLSFKIRMLVNKLLTRYARVYRLISDQFLVTVRPINKAFDKNFDEKIIDVLTRRTCMRY